MKAEQRKELETNTLADRMGLLVQRVKASQRRTVLLYLLGAVVLLVCLWYSYNWWYGRDRDTSEQWILFHDGSRDRLQHVGKENANTPAGKAARLQIAWFLYWHGGIKSVGGEPTDAMEHIRAAKKVYEQLVEDCSKDDADKVFHQQALLGLAVSQESLAVQSREFLSKAKTAYKELADAYPKSAEGRFAKERLEILNDKTKRAELEDSYGRLQDLFKVRAPAPALPLQLENIPKFGDDKK
jgi:hypothetical protein